MKYRVPCVRSVLGLFVVSLASSFSLSAQFQPIRINCGGAAYTGAGGVIWQADQYFIGGANLYTSDSITGTNDLVLYRPARYGLYTDFSYQIPVPNGTYSVRLHFAELQYYTAGYRTFHVDLNGTRVLSAFDIAGEAGGGRRAITRDFAANVTNGQIRLDFVGVLRKGQVNAIEITAAGPPAPQMSVSPAALTFAAVAGGTNPAAQSANVTITGGALAWTAVSNRPWLAVSPASGSATTAAAVTVNTAGLAAGSHTGALTFTAGGIPQTVNVTLNLAPAPSLSLSPASLSFTAIQGGANPASRALNLTVANGPLAWTATSNQPWLAVLPASGSVSAALAVSAVTSGLTAGAYTGSVTVNSAAGTQIIPVSMTVTPPPNLSISPASLSFSGNLGGANPAAQALNLSVSNGPLNWTATVNQPWLAVSPASGSATSALAVSVNIGALTAGSFTGAVTIQSAAGTQTVPVSLTVTATPSLSLAPTSLSFAAVQGGTNPASQAVAVNVANGPLNWTAASNQPWLAVSPAGGSASGTLAVSVNAASLAAGAHSGTITVNSTAGTQTVAVTLTVSPPPTLSVAPGSLTFSANQGGANPPSQPLSLTVANGPLNWTASATQPWLQVSPASGSASGSLTVSVNSASLAAGTFNGAVTVSSAAGTSVIPVSLTVTVQPSLSLSPASLSFNASIGGTNPSGQQAMVTIANGNASWTASANQPWLQVSPASGSGSAPLTITATLGSLTAGSYSGSVTVTSPGAVGSPAVIPVSFTVSAPPGTGPTIRINCGGPAYTGPGGNYQADTHFVGGANYYTSDGIQGTADLQLLRAARYGLYTDFAYQIPVPNGAYLVKLKFAELQFYGAGYRRFHVDLNSARVLENFDIALEAGGARRAMEREFAVSVSGGQIRMDFTGVTGRPMVNAIEITPVAAPVTMLSVSPATLVFAGPGTQQVAVSANAAWTATSNQAWLSATPAAGSTSGNVAVNVATLPPGTHTGTITFAANGVTQTLNVTVNITQLTVAPTTLTFTAPGTQQVALTSNAPWTATSNQSWLTTTPASGSTSGNVAVNVATLPPGTHTGVITFNANGVTQTLNVTVTITELTVAPSTLTFTAPGTQQVALTANAPWTATSNQSWLTTTPASGSTSGNVAVNVATLPPGTHTGAITFSANGVTQTLNVTVNITQLTVAPTTLTFTAPGTQQVALTSNAPWTATSNQSWLTTTPASGSTSGNVAVNVAALPPGTHTGTITFAANGVTQTLNVTVTITELTVAPSTLTFTAPGTQQVALTANAPWTATSNQSWLTTTPASGSTSGNVAVNVATLPPGTHTGAITFSANGVTQTLSVTVNITQLTVAPSILTFTAPGTQQVALTANAPWTAASNQSWLTTTPASGSTSGNVAINVTTLPPGTHSGTITFAANGVTQTLNVTVNITELTVAPSTLTFTAPGTQQVALTANAPWTATSNQSWLTTTPTSGTTSGNVAVNVATLPPGTHTGTITFAANGVTQTLSVTATITELTVAPSTLTFSAPGTQQAALTSNAPWTATSNQSWLTTTPASGTTSGNVAVNVATLPPGTHTGTITFAANGVTQTLNVTVNITQLTVAPSTLTFTAPGTQQVAITANAPWNATPNQSWLTTTPASGSTSGNVAVNVATLPPGTHAGTITFAANGVTQTLNVTATITELTVAPSTLTFTAPGTQQVALTSNAPWTATSNQAWLNTTPASGSTSGNIAVNVATLPPGTHTGAITFAANGVTQTLNVTVTITELTVAPSTLTFTAPGTQQVAITANAPWNATPNQSWLTTTPASGSTSGNVTVNVATLPPGTHTGAITFAANGVTQTLSVTVNITQLTVTPSTLTFSAPGTQQVALTSNAPWTAASNQSWLTTTPASGSTSGNVAVNVATLPPGTHTGTITFAANGVTQTLNVTVNITQLTVAPTTLTFTAPGTQQVALTANAPWTATSNQAWLTTTPTSGSTSGNIAVNVAALPPGTHTGVITFNANGVTQTLNVTVNITELTVAPTTLTFTAPGTQQVALTAIAPWTATPNQSWLTTKPTSGSTSGNVAVNVATLPPGTHTGTITFAANGVTQTLNVTVNITQLTVAPTTLTFTAPGTQQVALTANAPWTATSNQAWLTTTPTSGTTSGNVAVNVATLPPGTHTGTITFAANGVTQTLNVTVNITELTVAPSTLTFTAPGTQQVALTANAPWTATSNQSWLTTTPASGTTSGNVSVNVATLPPGSHTGTITFAANGVTQTLSVTVNITELTVAPTTLTFTAPGTQQVALTSNAPWTATSNQSWLTTTPASGTTSGNVAVNVATLPPGSHTGTITFAANGVTQTLSVTVTITELTVAPSTLTFTAPGTQQVALTANAPWTATSNQSWLTTTPTSGTTSGNVAINVATLPPGTHTGTITFAANGVTQTLNVTVTITELTVAPTTITFSAPGTQQVALTANAPWTAASNQSWLTTTPTSGTTSGNVAVNVATLPPGTHAGTITFAANGVTQTLNVTATITELTVAPTTLTFSAPGTQQVALTANAPWTATPNQSWLTTTPASGTTSGNVAVNVATLPPGTHTGAITFAANGVTQTLNVTVNITQLTVAPTTLTFTAPSTQQVALTANAPWTATSSQSWLTTTPASGSTSGNVAVNVATLPPGTHTGAITFAANGVTQTLNVTVTITELTVAPTTLTFTAPGTQQVALTANAPWTATPNQSWLTTTPASGTTSGNVTVNVATLPPGTHSGTITFAANGVTQTLSVTVTITELTVTPTSLTFTAPGTQQVALTANAPWTATSNQSWLTTTPTSSSTSGNVSVNVTTLPPGTHTGAITFTSNNLTQTLNVTVNITQLTVTPTTLTFTAPGTQQVALIANSAWTATSNQAWLTTTPASGSTSGNVTVNVATLPPGTHTGTITFAANGVTQTLNVTVTITELTVAPTTLTFTAPGTQQVALTANAPWTAASNQAWLTTTPTSGSTSGNVAVNVATLPPGTHTGVITFNANGVTQTLNVTVNITELTVAPTTLTFTAPGTQQVALTANAPWTATSNQSWLTTTPTSSSTSGNVSVNVTTLPPGTHTGTITFAANGVTQTLNVTVNITELTVAPTTLTFTAPGTQQVALTANAPWTATPNQSWLTTTPASGSTSGNVAVNVATLPPGTHTGTITFTSNNLTQTLNVTVNITQLTVTPATLTFTAPTAGPQPAPQGTTLLLAGSPAAWTAQTNQPWLQVTPSSGAASAELQVSATTTGLASGIYNGTITFQAPGATQTATVTLHVAPPLTATPGGLAYFATAGSAPPAAQTFQVLPTAPTVPWTITKQRPWVTVTPTSGAGPGIVTVTVNHAGLSQGIYNDVIVVAATDHSNAPADVFLSLNVSAPQSGPRDFYVSPTGLPTNDGSFTAPWDLVTALAHPASVHPGDRILVRGGIYGNGQVTYFNRLAGSATSPIVLKNYPGERATINGHMQVGCCNGNPDPSQGANVWIWGLEFSNSTTDRTGCSAGPPCWGATPSRPALDVFAPGARLINNIIHDTTQGVGWWSESTDSELYGNLIYYNGYQAPDRGHGHGVYSQNFTGLKKLLDNIVFDQFGFGFHLYGTTLAQVRNYLIEGNIAFHNGSISEGSRLTDNLLVAGGSGDAHGITVRNNHFYYPPERDLGRSELGWIFSVQNGDLTVTNNHFIGGYESVAVSFWQTLTFTGNTMYARTWTKAALENGVVPFSSYLWNHNTYYGASNFRINNLWREFDIWRATTGFDANSTNFQTDPTGVWVFARPNAYESGRGHIAVYNWAQQSQVPADLSGILTPGTAYEIRDAQNFFAAPLVTGVYTGGAVSIPMSGLTAAAPVGTVPVAPVHQAPKFGVFVVLPQGSAPILR